ncbi:MAG TPA: hypothetical protein VHU40_13915 [Polyangia bacterium]|jgi:hypothetical protein|nr:hypothetical protein [Polyangia bacterium]
MAAEFVNDRSLNARVGAVSLALSGFLTLLLSHVSASLAPMRLLAVAGFAFAAWCFCDEMGLRKPLNRAGFVLFGIAMAAKVQRVLGVGADVAGRYDILFAAFLMLALLMWSVAFLHRQRSVKVVGALGVVASLTPIVALIVGHVAVGAGAFLGVKGLLAASGSGDHTFVTLVERILGLWGYGAAWLLWRGHIRRAPAV